MYRVILRMTEGDTETVHYDIIIIIYLLYLYIVIILKLYLIL